jgi:hypothetical protein
MSNTVAPQGEIQGQMVVDDNNSVKRSDIQNLIHGLNPGVLYAVVDLGTHMEAFQGQAPTPTRKIFIGFEHPQLKQLFYEDDTVPRSTVSSIEGSMSLGDKSKLKALINAASGKALTYDEAKAYNLSHLLGQKFNVNIEITPGKKDPTAFYNKVTGVFSGNGMALPVPFEPEMKYLYFFIDKDKNGNTIGNNFMTSNYANLPNFLRKKILSSKEGMEYAQRGGKFAENPKVEKGQQAQPQQPQQPQQAVAQQNSVPAITMLVNDFTLEQYLGSGWTIESLVQHGKARLNTPAPAPQMQQAPPSGPPAPQQMGANPAQVPQQGFAQQSVPPAVNGGNFLDDNPDDMPF